MANQEQSSTTTQNTPALFLYSLSLSHSRTITQTKQLNKTKTITIPSQIYHTNNACPPTCTDLYAAPSNGAVSTIQSSSSPTVITPSENHTGSLPCPSTRSNQCHRHILCPRSWIDDEMEDWVMGIGEIGDRAWGGSAEQINDEGVGQRAEGWGRWGNWPDS